MPTDRKAQISRALAEQRIGQALLSIGLTFAESAGLIEFDEKAETAFWKYNRQTGEESIHIGPAMASLPVASLEMVIRHEVLHRSMFNGFGEKFANARFSNLVLDICINRLLRDAYPEPMFAASMEIYPPDSKKTLIALADCTADTTGLPVDMKPQWDSIWRSDGTKFPAFPNPSSLYYQLLRFGKDVILVGNPFGDPEADLFEEGIPYPSEKMRRAAGKVLGDLRDKILKGAERGAFLEEFSVVPVSIATGGINNFIERMRLRRIIDRVASKLTEPLRGSVRIQPYPMFPTRLGLMYQILGISEVYSLYWNRDTVYQGVRFALGLYIDVSGSMIEHFPVVCGVADVLKEYPLRIKAFDEKLRAVEIEDIASGRITGGGGTDFNPPIHDFVNDPELVAGMLFTDGEGTVSPETASELRQSRKKLYVIFLSRKGKELRKGPLAGLAADSIII